MKKIFFFSIIMLSLSSCSSDQSGPDKINKTDNAHDSILKIIRETEASIQNNMKNSILDPALASMAVKNYMLYSEKFPDDTATAMFLFKASDVYSSAMHQYDQSTVILDRIISKYPSFRKLPICYFQMGVLYDDYLNDDKKAKEWYEKFIAKFPSHQLVPQVKTLITYLGRSNDDLLKEFEKKNK